MSQWQRSFHVAGLFLGAVLTLALSCSLQAEDDRFEGLDPYSSKPRRWSSEWYANEAQTPVGSRQKRKFGKLWPPIPRPVGKEQQFSHRYHAAHYWPYPYRCDDRNYVHSVSSMQVDSGWITATTLFDYHFEDETNELNHAGREHVRWILEAAPIQRRVIHVQYGRHPEVTEMRMASARAEAASIVGPEAVPPILMRVTSPFGRPAAEIDAIRRAERESLPEPRIQYTTGAGSGGQQQGGGM